MNIASKCCFGFVITLAIIASGMELPDPAPYLAGESTIEKVAPKLVARDVVSREGKTIKIPVFLAGNKLVTLARIVGNEHSEKNLCDVNIIVDDKEVSMLKWWGANKQGFGYPYKSVENRPVNVQIDCSNGIATVTKAYIGDDGRDRQFSFRMKALPESKIEITWNDGQLWHFTKDFVGRELFWNGEPHVFTDATFPADKSSFHVYVKGNFRYADKSRDKEIAIEYDPAFAGGFSFTKNIYGTKVKLTEYGGITRYDAKMKRAVLDLGECRIQKSVTPAPIGGIDFWKNDKLHVPRPATRNILPNPSFEQGLRFWHWTDGGAKYTEEKIRHEIVPEGLFGRSALAFHPTQNGAAGIETFPIALEAGKTYTLSIYAKGLNDGARMSLAIGSVSRDGKFRGKYGTIFGDIQSPEAQFKLTKEWKRHSRTFVADSGGIRILLCGSGDTRYDAMQLEEGDKATEFVLPPIEGNFVTAKPDNDIFKGEEIDAAFEFQGKSGTSGTVNVSIGNAYGETIGMKKLNVKIGETGFTRMALPIDAKVVQEGIFVVRADYAVGNLKWTQYYRFNVMSPLSNTHATKDVFGTLHAFGRITRGEDVARKYRDWGFGSTSWGYRDQDGIKAKLEKKYGIRNYIHVLSEKDKKWGPLIRKITEVTDDMVKEVEECAYNEAKKLDPEQAFAWALYNEEEGAPMVAGGKFDEYFKLQHAAARGVKRANPNALVSATHGTSGYSILRGHDAYEGYFKAALKHGYRYDAVGIHPYNAVDGASLGSLDLDHDVQMLIDQMKRYGYPDETPIYLSEMFNVPFVKVPEWNPKSWGDVWRTLGTFTYAIGNREFIHAASAARVWLVALKHWPKVRMTNVWMSEPYLDVHLSPILMCKVANTMGHLMPDVKFHSESRPSANIRAYVFERRGESPIAAIWCIDADVENGMKRGPEVEVKFGQRVSFVDLMGCNRTAKTDKNGITKLRLTPAPLFIVADDVEKLSASLKAITSTDVAATLAFSIEPKTDGSVKAVLKNKTISERRGNIVIDGRKHGYKLAGGAEQAFPAVEKRSAEANKLFNVHPAVKIVPSKGDAVDVEWNMDYVYVPHVAGEPDWEKLPGMKITNRHGATGTVPAGDHEAEWKAAWNKDGFYVRVDVTDDDFTDTSAAWAKTGSEKLLWEHDGALELYFDCGANGRITMKPNYDDDDYRYDFAHKDGVGRVWRWKEVNQQYADGVNMPTKEEASQRVICDFMRTEKGYSYTIKFAERYILPITLRKGFSFGFAIYLHDKDSGRPAKALTTGMRPGAHCQAAPAFWPMVILGGE